MIKAIVVDDEAPARREMRRLLEDHGGVAVAGEAKDLATARGLALRTRPDVVFLDIRLGRESGFDLLPELDEAAAVVFVTAYDAYAVRAFEAHALDYLVKPVDPDRLAGSISRVEAFLAEREPAAPTPFTRARWVFLEAGDRAEFVEVPSITRIDAEGGGTRVRTVDGVSIHTPRSLKEWARRLPMTDFRRVHRSTIVNLARVERAEPWSHYTYRLHLADGSPPVVMSRRYAARLREELG